MNRFVILSILFICIGLSLSTGGQAQEGSPSSENFLDSAPSSETQREASPPANAFFFDLTDCVRMALRNNSEIRGAGYEMEASEWKLKEAQPRFTPVIEYEYEGAPVPKDASNAVESFFKGDVTMENRFKVGLGIPVTTFGKLQLAQRLAKGGVAASQEKKNQKAGEVVLKIKQLYYGTLLAREFKEMLQEAQSKLNQEISKRENSNINPLDLAKLRLAYYEVLKRLGEAAKKEELALQGLRITMGLNRWVGFDLSDKHLRPVEFELKPLEFYVEESKRFRPESRLLDIAIKAKEDEYRLEKRKLLPNFGIGAFLEMGRTLSEVRNVGNTSDFNDPFNFTRAGVGMRLKGEFNWSEAHARIRQKQAEYYKMSITKDYAEEGLDLDIQDAYLSVRQSKVDLENADKARAIARQMVFLSKTNADVGVADAKELGEALQAYLLMKGRYYESVFNYNVAVATLIGKVGYQFEP